MHSLYTVLAWTWWNTVREQTAKLEVKSRGKKYKWNGKAHSWGDKIPATKGWHCMGVSLSLQECRQQPCPEALRISPSGWGCSTCNRRGKTKQAALDAVSPSAGTGGSRAPAHPGPAWLKQVPAIFTFNLQFTPDLLLSSKGEAAVAMLPAHWWRRGGYSWEGAHSCSPEMPSENGLLQIPETSSCLIPHQLWDAKKPWALHLHAPHNSLLTAPERSTHLHGLTSVFLHFVNKGVQHWIHFC